MYNLKAMDLLTCFSKAPSPAPVAEHELQDRRVASAPSWPGGKRMEFIAQ